MSSLPDVATALRQFADFTRDVKPSLVDVAIFVTFLGELIRFTFRK